MYRTIYMQIADVWLYLALVLHIWISALISKYYLMKLQYLTGTNRGKLWPWVIFQNASKVASFFFPQEICATVPPHMNTISSWSSDNPTHVVTAPCRAHVPCWHHTGTKGASPHVLQSRGVDHTCTFFKIQKSLLLLSHVEGSCCPRKLRNTRWFQSCYPEEVISRPVIFAVIMLLWVVCFHCV